MHRVGFIGLGRMGMPMCRNVARSGAQIVGYDPASPQPDFGCEMVASVAEVAQQVDTVFLSLPGPPEVQQVADDLAKAASGQLQLVVDLSTTGVEGSREAAAQLTGAGVGFLDSPVSGGVDGAINATLAVMSAGERTHFRRAEPILEQIGNVFYVGDTVGLGQSMKLLNNFLSATALIATSEAFLLGAQAGLSADTMVQVVNASSGVNSATMSKFPRSVLTGSFDFGFAMGLLEKDVRLFTHEAAREGLELPVSQLILNSLAGAVDDVGPGADITEIARIYERQAETPIRGS